MYNHQEYIEKHKRKNGWRLPTIEELLSLVDYSKYGPASKVKMASNLYWSYTTRASNTSSAWYVDFYYGNTHFRNKTDSIYVRCVRDTPNGLEWSKDAPIPMSWYDAMKYAEEL